MSARAPAPKSAHDGLIELRDVSIRFRYQQVLRNINLTIGQPNGLVWGTWAVTAPAS